MSQTSFQALEKAIRGSWCLWTSDPADQVGWSDANRASGQCASTALVVQDHLGGELIEADVRDADDAPRGYHYWNRLPDGRELDLTHEQFRRGEQLIDPRPVPRPVDVTRGRLPGQYHLLSIRVKRALACPGKADRERPVSIKGVCLDAEGRVLLCRNHRGDWELPGGRPDPGEPFQDCLEREVLEETGVKVSVDRLLGVRAIDAGPEGWFDLVGYECQLSVSGVEGLTSRPSPEHAAVAFLDPTGLAEEQLPRPFKELIALAES